MKFIGKLLLWIGGGALLYADLYPLSTNILAAFDSGNGLGMGVQEYLLAFSRPLFVFGVICAAGLPELKPRRKKTSRKPIEASSSARVGVASEKSPTVGVRLNTWLAEQGVDSRRKCDEKVFCGEVSVNGTVIIEPGHLVLDGDDVRVNGVKRGS